MAEYDFTPEQRRILDRYRFFLSTFVATHDKANKVFDRRAKLGHQRTGLPYDSRLNNTVWGERNLEGLWKRVEALRDKTSGYMEALVAFRQEALELTARTSRSEPVGQVDISNFSLVRSPIWNSSVPRTIQDVVYRLGNLFFAGKGDMIFIEKIIQDVHEHSFGLKSIYTRAMGYRTCECHEQPTVAPELFRAPDTVPLWDIDYSSADPLIKAREYEADVTRLFNQLAPLCVQMGTFFEEVSHRFDSVRVELSNTESMTTLRRLNLMLGIAQEIAEELMDRLNHIESWLRK